MTIALSSAKDSINWPKDFLNNNAPHYVKSHSPRKPIIIIIILEPGHLSDNLPGEGICLQINF